MRTARLALPRVAAVLLAAMGCGEAEAPGGEAHQEAVPLANGGDGTAEDRPAAGSPAADPGHEDVVRLTDEALRSAQIRVAPVESAALHATLTVPASLALTQDGTARVAARVPGRVVELGVKPGDRVEAGQELGVVSSPELGSLRAAYMAAATKARVARAGLDRQRGLFEEQITSQRELLQAEATWAAARAERDAVEDQLHTLGLTDAEIWRLVATQGHQGATFPLRSPIAGTVLAVNATPGESVDATTNLFTVGQLDELWALLQVPEGDVVRVREGQPVRLSLKAAPDHRFEGTVDYVGSTIDPRTRTAEVRLVIPNPERTLRPGMFATAEIATGNADAPRKPVVPREAVQSVEGSDVVFVQSAPNEFRAVPVRIGTTTGEQAEIVEGLQGDEQVVVAGAFVLKSELSKETLGEGHSH